MDISIYRLMHVAGLFFLFAGLGGLMLHAAVRGQDRRLRVPALAAHGLGLLLLLVSGFGMLARLGIHWPWPTWVWVKAGVWLALGGVIVVLRRAPGSAPILWWILPLLGVLAGWMAFFKPLV